jgi:hypothetical protein
VRASVQPEKLGVPSASVVSEGFIIQGHSVAVGSGRPNLPLAMIPGHPDHYTRGELRKVVETVTLDQVIKALTVQPHEAKLSPESEPKDRDVVFVGTFEEVNKFFYDKKWQEGIPIVPPTIEKVDEFLRFTDRSPTEVLGTLLPDSREATIWNIAVNGVMAGCRPEYMPVLIALVEVMVDPQYGVEHSSNSPGAEALITVNGPIINDLDFNYGQGVLRVGFQANTSIGRFWRLYLRNVAGFLPHNTDKGTFGNTWRVVLAENEDALAEIGWKSTSVDQGFNKDENVVTVARYTSGGVIISVFGSSAKEMLPYLEDGLVRHIGWEIVFTTGTLASPGYACSQRPHLILSPCIAEVLAKSGYSKDDVREHLYEHARIPAWKIEQIGKWSNLMPATLSTLVEAGVLPKQFCEFTDPNRMVPIVCSPKDFLISVSGDPLRNNAYVFAHNGRLGYTTSKKIGLPMNWDRLLKEAKEK